MQEEEKSILSMDIGNALKVIRAFYNETLDELEVALFNKRTGNWTRYENNIVAPKLYILELFAAHYELKLSDVRILAELLKTKSPNYFINTLTKQEGA